jgi:hypothetical protein
LRGPDGEIGRLREATQGTTRRVADRSLSRLMHGDRPKTLDELEARKRDAR